MSVVQTPVEVPVTETGKVTNPITTATEEEKIDEKTEIDKKEAQDNTEESNASTAKKGAGKGDSTGKEGGTPVAVLGKAEAALVFSLSSLGSVRPSLIDKVHCLVL